MVGNLSTMKQLSPKDLLNGRSGMGNLMVNRSIKALIFGETKPPSKGTGKEDSCLLGTYAIYQGRDFTDFTMEMDVFAADNDGMGIVWGFTGEDKHHRVIMINDKWPSPALDKSWRSIYEITTAS